MTTSVGPGAEAEYGPFDVPEAEEALAGLAMALEDAMRSQRAVRRLHPDPVPHEVLLPLLELALKAPTSSNSQDWSFVVVEDSEQKRRLGRLYGVLYRAFNPIEVRRAEKAGDERALRQMRPEIGRAHV